MIVQEPRIFCNPVEKTINGGTQVFPILDEDQHLACYNIIEEPIPDDHDETHNWVDQFDVWPLTAHEHLLLCVPSTKALKPPGIPPGLPSLGAWATTLLTLAMVAVAMIWFARRRSIRP